MDELQVVIRQKEFCVKVLAAHVGLDVRTLERRFREQLRTTPKAWIMRERMNCALPSLAEGLSNKQIAASLSYSCESNFCRDFKRCFGCAPQVFTRITGAFPLLSRFDKRAELRRKSTSTILQPCSASYSKDLPVRCKATESRVRT